VKAEPDEEDEPAPVGADGGDIDRIYFEVANLRRYDSGRDGLMQDDAGSMIDREEVLALLSQRIDKPQPTPAPEFRAGLPPLALRLVCSEWIDQDGDTITFSSDGESYRCQSPHFTRLSLVDFDAERLRPKTGTFAEVERLAAQRLGTDDAKAGREMRPTGILAQDLGIGFDRAAELEYAYRDGYEAGKGAA
jgi:hypothetical protein